MSARCLPSASLGALLLSLLLAACGEDPPPSLHTKAEAEATARLIVEAWAQGDMGTLREQARVPFHFARRIWSSQEELAENLAVQAANVRLREQAASVTGYEVFSHWDLMQGRWPRGRTVPESRRVQEARSLGVGQQGFLVRAYDEHGQGWLLVLNSTGGRLILRGVYP